jgi:maltose alpha-D-glucosyltransferase/alpha-amylase
MAATQPDADRPADDPAGERLPALDGLGDPADLLEGPGRETLERSVLPAFVRGQRWFGGKARTLEAVRLADVGEVPVAGGGRVLLALFRAEFAGGATDLYFLPLGVTAGPAAEGLLASRRDWVIARLGGRAGGAVLHDALADDDFCTALVGAAGAGRSWATRAGTVQALATRAFGELRGEPDAPLAVQRGPATSSNSLVFYGDRLLLKLFRRLEPGINPDFEIGRFLTEETSFDRIPRVAGAVEYHRPGQPPMTLAILQQAVANQGDGWQHALGELSRYFGRMGGHIPHPDPRPLADLAEVEPPAAAREAVGDYLDAAGTLGRRTAEMHRALAGGRDNPAFAPEPLSTRDLADFDADVVAHGRLALAALHDNVGRLPGAVAPAARRLLEEGPAVVGGFRRAQSPEVGVAKVRCHGDYHLGQVLVVGGDFVILDFEGEPTRTVEQRRAKTSPLKDVAGMLRSFHYAAHAGLFAATADKPEEHGRLEPAAEAWSRWVSAAFLRAYRGAAGDAEFLPRDRGAFSALLDTFILGKAFYELAYELNNRPDWVRIPLRGIQSLLGPAGGAGSRKG